MNFNPNSSMSSKQLIDSLTSHISLYHSSNPDIDPSPNPRSSILKWFSSLTVHQRQASITIVDSSFTQLVVRMLRKSQSQGHGFFIVLPDLLSDDLPTICFRKSHGLLSRIAESDYTERVVYESILLFSSKEGEHVSPRSCSERSLDTVSVCEEFVGNVDKFVAVMDAVSSGRFLRGEESELGSDWVELKWLKAKGYYNMEAFLVNRMEVALRLAWFNCSGGGGKKRGVKFKEKANAAGVAANVLWRKKGCVDWWDRLNSDVRRKMLISMLGKASKAMTQEFLKEGDNALGEAMCLCGASREQLLKNSHNKLCQMAIKIPLRDADEGLATSLASIFDNPTPLTNIYGSLFVLWSICSVMFACLSGDYSRDKIFYSTLDSITTISDCITRKLRGLLMAVSLNCTEIELLGEGNSKSPSSKGQEKAGNSSTRKKGNTRNLNRLNAETRLHGGDFKLNVSCKDHKGASAQIVESKRTDGVLHAEALHRESLSSLVEKEHSEGFDGKVSKCARKVRKGKNKNRTPGLHDSPKHQKLKNYSPCVASEGDVATNRNLLGSSNIVSNSRPDSTTNGCSSLEGTNVQSSCGDLVSASSNNGCHAGAHFVDDAADGVTNTRTMVSKAEISDCMASGNEIAPQLGVMDFDGVLSTEDSNSLKPGHASDIDKKIPHQVFNLKEETCQAKECGTGPASYSQCLSYEWPSVAPVNFSLASSHLPAATDRLHLDVGHNWCNHLHQSFMPAIHQARNSSIQTGRSHILTHQIPNGSDWPPIVRGANTIDSSVICNYDSGFISRHQSSFPQAFTIHNSQLNSTTMEDERKCYGDLTELSDVGNLQEISDVGDSQWISDDEYEVHTVSRMDYNQYFGGGVMYWNPTDHLGTGFSRPPSLSSDDSSWAWRDAEMKKDVDDMVAFPSSYSTNGLASPTAASLCSAFDCLGTGLGYIMPGKEVTGSAMLSLSTVTDAVADHRISSSLASKTSDVERNADLLPQSILRPITIPSMSRKTSRSEFKRAHDHTSPCVPPTRREQPRIKRPPSPVVLCVPRTHCPPRPCPVSDSRKHRGLPTVRSGSSSPRNWSTRDSYGEGTGFEESSVRMDGTGVFWPSWRSDNFSACPLIQPLAGALLQDHLIALSQMALDQEHPDVGFPLEPSDLSNCAARKASLSLMQNLLHDEIDSFCKLVAAENLIRKRYINWAVKRVARSLQVLWPRSRTNIFGSIATGLSLPSSDVDLVVCLPPVRNLEPIKEAGILEGRNGIKETCLQHAARYLSNQEWVKNDSLKTVENTAIPIIMLVVEVPLDLVRSTPNIQIPDGEPTQKAGTKGKDVPAGMVGLKNSATSKCSLVQHDGEKNFKSLHLDISFKSLSHTGLQTTEMVKELQQFPATAPLALVLKKFLADRSLDQSYSGGLSSYCLVLLITRFLQHEHHLGRPINQNYGRLLMDFLYFFGNVFDPRQMGVAVQGSGVYLKRERGSSIDPIHIDDPLFPTNNVGRNCFRIHQCIKAFSDAYSVLENELACLPSARDADEKTQYRLLPKIIQSIDLL